MYAVVVPASTPSTVRAAAHTVQHANSRYRRKDAEAVLTWIPCPPPGGPFGDWQMGVCISYLLLCFPCLLRLPHLV